LGCTATVAFAAALSALNLYALALELGADQKRALAFSAIIYFEPSFLFYTSDMYKDGLVVCFVVGALASAIRLGSKLSVRHALIGLACVGALWYVRYYLIFVTVTPLLVGIAGLGSKSFGRTVLAVLVLATGVLAIASFTDMLQLASERAEETFERGTALTSLASNASKGSGVVFDDGGVPYRALGPKIAYTLFSPFLWSGGSFGLQVGKLDVVLWYFVIYRAVRAVRTAERRVVMMLASFIVPCTIMYAMTMSNVGLIVRQRLVVVAATAVLASLYRPKKTPRVVQRVRRHAASPSIRRGSVAA
jgi:hypothetical protein